MVHPRIFALGKLKDLAASCHRANLDYSDLPLDSVYNINVPALAPQEITGIEPSCISMGYKIDIELCSDWTVEGMIIFGWSLSANAFTNPAAPIWRCCFGGCQRYTDRCRPD